MITLTRTADCPNGSANTTTKMAGFVSPTNTRLLDAIAASVGYPAVDLAIDYVTLTVMHDGVQIATLTESGKPT